MYHKIVKFYAGKNTKIIRILCFLNSNLYGVFDFLDHIGGRQKENPTVQLWHLTFASHKTWHAVILWGRNLAMG